MAKKGKTYAGNCTPKGKTGQIPSISGVFIVWLISGLLTFFSALV